MKNQSHKMLSYCILSFVIATVIVMHPTGEIHAQQPISIKIDKWFSNSQVIFPFVKTERIYRLAISGSIQLYEDSSLIRVILVGDDFNEYLVYEAYPLIVDSNSLQIISECEETCDLEAIMPNSLKIELIDASIHIDRIALFDSSQSGRLKSDAFEAQTQIKISKHAEKIRKINENLKKKGLKWVAGETSISILSYEEKKRLFGDNMIPNLQGFEFYKSGIFEIKTGDTSSFLTNDEGASSDEGSSLIEHFDWRNRHGANNPSSPYYDGDPTGSGWITSITSQGCGDCWAHSAVGATEALANLYFNQHLDVNFGLNLSIQDVVSCSGAGSCSGGNSGGALNYIANSGVVDEDCFPYAGSDEQCDDKCPDPDEIIRINGQDGISRLDGEENIKRNLIDHGPLNFGIGSWSHSMVLVGFDKDTADEETIWILKNSWGTGWGENGYGSLKVALSDMYLMHVLTPPVTSDISSFETVCLDSDGDGYYNWGISDIKPDTCPAHSSDVKDCDDNNASLGPFDSDGSCVEMVIVDNKDAGFSSGPNEWPWSSFTPGGYNKTYQYALPGDGSKWAKWTFQLNSSGNCEVFAQWTAHDNRSTAAPYTINNNGTEWTVTVDQTINGGRFMSLGTYFLEAGTVEVVLNDTSTGCVIADAVKIVFEGDGARTLSRIEIVGPSSIDENSGADFVCRAYYTDGTDLEVSADSWTDTCDYADVDNTGYLTTFELDANEECQITASYTAGGVTKNGVMDVTIKDTNASEMIIDNGDAGFSSGPNEWSWSSHVPGGYNKTYQYALPGDGSKWAKWTFQLNSSGNCEVFAQWTAHDNRSTVAPYTINNNGTEWTVTVDQTINGGRFMSLGTYFLEAGTVEVLLNDTSTGCVIADAVKVVYEGSIQVTVDNKDTFFTKLGAWGTSSAIPGYYGSNYRYATPDGGDKWAKWTFLAVEAGIYEIYAQWAAFENRSPAAPYTIRNNGTVVGTATADQTQNGGQFNKLGTFDLTAGNLEVVLTDTPTGYVIADAVQVILK